MNRHIALIFLKIVLTLPVAYGLAYPYFHPEASGGVFKELEMLGPIGGIVLVLVFLALVFLYCRDLQSSLALVQPAARKAQPRSVWLMFLLPYNFVEDFFIIANVARSLQQEAKTNAALQGFTSFGMLTGMGWCGLQIVSLIPNELGAAAGFLALPCWILHWRLIRRANAALAAGATQTRL